MSKNKKRGDNRNRTFSNRQKKMTLKVKTWPPLTTDLVQKCIFDFFHLNQKAPRVLSTYICEEVPRLPLTPNIAFDFYCKEEWPNQLKSRGFNNIQFAKRYAAEEWNFNINEHDEYYKLQSKHDFQR